MTKPSDAHLTDKDGDPVEVIEAYLCSDHVWVRHQDGSTETVKTSDLRRL